MLTLLTRLYLALVQYLFTLLAFYDPITGSSDSPKTEDSNFLGVSIDQLYNSRTKQSSSSSFLWPFIWLVLFEVIGIFGLEMDSSGWPPWPPGPLWSQLATSPVIFAHQIIPRAVWPQIDLFIYTAVNGALVAAAALYRTPPVGDAHRLEVKKQEERGGRDKGKRLLVTNSSTFMFRRAHLDERSSATILRLRSALYRYFYPLVAVFVAVLLSFYYLMVYLNGAFRWSALSLLYWSAVFPVAIFHAIIGKEKQRKHFIYLICNFVNFFL